MTTDTTDTEPDTDTIDEPDEQDNETSEGWSLDLDLDTDVNVDYDALADDTREIGEFAGKHLSVVPKAAGVGLWKATEGVLIGLTRVVPRGAGLWQRWIAIGYGNLKRASNADRINHVQKQGHILHRPIYWNSEKDRWETKNGTNWWNGGKQHQYTGPNGVPCSWAASSATELGNQVQSEVSEALELGVEQDLYRMADVEIQNTVISPDAGDNASGQGAARADGGQNAPIQRTTVNVDNPGILEDQLVNLDQLYFGEDADQPAAGRLVSMESYYETYPETIDSEEMQKQEDRGKLATMNDGDTWKMALYFMGAALLFILAWEYLPQFLGSGGGGGGGGIMPF